MPQPSISIIVPVFKAEKHIPRLMADVQKQTFDDWELILVNDGSPDNTLQVCEQCMKNDARVHVINQQNLGPSAARNNGIRIAKGEWITFVDADDALLDNFLLSMIAVTGNNRDIDLVYAGYIIVGRSGNEIYTYNTSIYEGFENVRYALTHTSILHRCCPWGRLFRRSIIMENKLCFDTQLSHSEDRLFVYNYLLHTRGIATTSTIGYIYDSTSITSLKHKHLALEMLYYRQHELQKAAHAVIDHYCLAGEECFMFAKHLFGLFAVSIQSLYEDSEKARLAAKCQQDYYDRFFDKVLYNQVQTSPKWQQFVSGNVMLEWAINRDFVKINSYLKKINRKIVVSNMIKKIRKQIPSQMNFMNAIQIMNQ